MHRKWSVLFLHAFFAFSLSGCGFIDFQHHVVGNTNTLSNLEKLHTVSYRYGQAPITELRQESLQTLGFSLGAQAGLAARSKQINMSLSKLEKALDRIFNFHLLMLPNNVLPPVLIQGSHSINVADAQTIRIADRTYQIIQQAKFVSVAPTWRDELWMHFEPPAIPDASLLPKNQPERQIWKKAVQSGWNAGFFEQAEGEFQIRLARLRQKYVGMLLYKKLSRQNIVSQPYVAQTELGVTGDQEMLRIQDHVLRITQLPTLEIDPQKWKPVVTAKPS